MHDHGENRQGEGPQSEQGRKIQVFIRLYKPSAAQVAFLVPNPQDEAESFGQQGSKNSAVSAGKLKGSQEVEEIPGK